MADLAFATFKSLIEDELILIPDAKLSQNIGNYIQLYSYKPQSLQYWYIRRHVLMYQLRRAAELVDTQNGPDKVTASQKFRALRQMLQDTFNQINMLDTEANVSAIGSVTPIHSHHNYRDVLEWLPEFNSVYWNEPILFEATCY